MDGLFHAPADNAKLAEVLNKLSADLEGLTRRVEAAAVVGDLGDHLWFQVRIGVAHRMLSGDYVYSAPAQELDEREYARAFRFVIDAGLRIQKLEQSPPATGSIRFSQSQEAPQSPNE